SGRPISFQMDLYPPLYVPRPTVEPERFASLRPPMYGGAITNPSQPVAVGMPGLPSGIQGGIGGGIGAMPGNPAQWGQNSAMFLNGSLAFNRYKFGGQVGQFGNQ